jgi:hypothetical protein
VTDAYSDRLLRNDATLSDMPIREIAPSTFIYPPQALADNYVHQFWECVHPVFPILHKPTFMTKYNKLWTLLTSSQNATTGDLLFPSTLNIVFALGCQYSNMVESSRKSSLAGEFYLRARRVAAFDTLDSISIASVQHLLLMGLYLQSTSSASSC